VRGATFYVPEQCGSNSRHGIRDLPVMSATDCKAGNRAGCDTGLSRKILWGTPVIRLSPNRQAKTLPRFKLCPQERLCARAADGATRDFPSPRPLSIPCCRSSQFALFAAAAAGTVSTHSIARRRAISRAGTPISFGACSHLRVLCRRGLYLIIISSAQFFTRACRCLGKWRIKYGSGSRRTICKRLSSFGPYQIWVPRYLY
jgi:hypothetical protein